MPSREESAAANLRQAIRDALEPNSHRRALLIAGTGTRSSSSSEVIGRKNAGGHKTPAAMLVASYINVTVRRSIAWLACVDRLTAFKAGGQFDFAKNDLVWHHFLGTHARRQHTVRTRNGVWSQMPEGRTPAASTGSPVEGNP
jgi:hypothetical protein